MARTERLASSQSRGGMLLDEPRGEGSLQGADIRAFLGSQRIAEALGQGDIIEYWKSAPYLFNFMDDYALKQAFTESDVTREANDGRGPVDFKVSRGSKDKTLVEFKLAKNSHLQKNLQYQAEIYQKASDADRAITVIDLFHCGGKKARRRNPQET